MEARALAPTCTGVGARAGQQLPGALSRWWGLPITQLLDSFAVGFAIVMHLSLAGGVQLDVAHLTEGEQNFLFLFAELILSPVIPYPLFFKAP